MLRYTHIIDQAPGAFEGRLGDVGRVEKGQCTIACSETLGDLLAVLGLATRKWDQKGDRNQSDQNNLTDLSAYIVRLSPNSGAITASPVVNIETQVSILGLNPSGLNLGDMIELSRRGTYNSNVTAQ